MHDCRKTKKDLIDLAFGELQARGQEVSAEITNCPSCSREYQSVLATLQVFDQAADALTPEESYWGGYEVRLRARLAESAAVKHRESLIERLASGFAGLQAGVAIPLVAAVLIAAAAISAAWLLRQRVGDPQTLATKASPSSQPPPANSSSEQVGIPQTQTHSEPQSVVAAANARHPRQHRQAHTPGGLAATAPDDLSATNSPLEDATRQIASGASPVTAPAFYFERAQLLLRSFRNARATEKSAAIDVRYEKRQARKLVYDNILLRREAEAKGVLPVEEALNSLEPLLLDIANLPDKPSRGEVQAIQERIQKQEIIATLLIVSSGAERFSPPASPNP